MKQPWYLKPVKWDTKPTPYDPNGCGGLYLIEAPRIRQPVKFLVYTWLFIKLFCKNLRREWNKQ